MKSLITTVLGMFVAASLYAPMSYAATDVTKANFEQTVGKAAAAGQNVVITFHATWCAACKSMLPKLDVAEKKYTNVKFFRIDIDKNPEVRVPFVPFTVLLKGQSKKGILQGAPPSQDALNKELEKAFGVK